MRLKILNGEVSSIHSAAFLMGAAGLLSRALGMLRDRMLAGHFGAGRELDAYYAAFQIPDFMSVIFLLGAASAAILPTFQEYLKRDEGEARNLISGIIQTFLLLGGCIALVVFLFAPVLTRLVTPGFSPSDQALTTFLTRIMLLSPLLLGLSSIFSAVVQSYKRFLAYALAPILYNVGIILGILFFVPWWGVRGLAFGVVLGAFLHMAIQLESLLDIGFKPRWYGDGLKNSFRHPGVQKILKISIPRFLAISLFSFTSIILVSLASTLGRGSIALYQLAYNLYFVPVGIFGISYAVALFPELNRAYLDRDAKKFYGELSLGIRTIFFWIAPSFVLFIVLRAHIVRIVLGAGAFSWDDTRLAAALLAAFAMALFAGGISTLLIRGFYALENTRLPLIINSLTAVVSIVSAYIFTELLKTPNAFSFFIERVFRISDISHTVVLGLALGFSLGLMLDSLFLYILLKRLAKNIFQESGRTGMGAVAKIIIAALVSGGVAYGVRVGFAQTLPLITFVKVFEQAVLAGALGFLVYFVMLLMLHSEEAFSFLGVMRRRLFQVGVLPKSWDREDVPLQ